MTQNIHQKYKIQDSNILSSGSREEVENISFDQK